MASSAWWAGRAAWAGHSALRGDCITKNSQQCTSMYFINILFETRVMQPAYIQLIDIIIADTNV